MAGHVHSQVISVKRGSLYANFEKARATIFATPDPYFALGYNLGNVSEFPSASNVI